MMVDGTHQIVPIAAARGDGARSHILKPKPCVEWYQVVMGKKGYPVGILGVFHALNVGLHENGS